MNRILILLLLIVLASCASSPTERQQVLIDDTDVGVYGSINRENQLTEKRFRLLRGKERWEIEDQRPDGSWENVTCEEGCLLAESTDHDVKRFMGGEPPPGMWAACLQNSVFAFCKVVKKGVPGQRYVFFALVEDQAIPIKLIRIK